MRSFVFSLCLLSGLATTASADIVPMPPAACPLGSNPRTCHGGAYCEVRNCQTDAECTLGGTCQEMRACFHLFDCLGRAIMFDAARPLYNSMKSACPSSGVCADTNQACQTQKICVMGSGTSTVTSPLTSTTTSVATRSNTASGTGTRSATQTVTALATSPTNTSTGVRTDPVTSVTSDSRTQSATATQTETRTSNATGLSTGTGSGTGTGQATAPTSSTGSGTGTGSTVATTFTGSSTGTSIATTADTTAQQTGVTTSTSATQDAGPVAANLGESGCSCRIGDWAQAKAIGPWLLAGMFGVVVSLARRRRGSRK